jgi:hypothetical protein
VVHRASFVAVLVVACSGTRAGKESDESTGGPIDFPAPDFLEPAGGELHLELTRDIDVDLDVSGVEPGRTILSIDGESVGTMLASPLGTLASGHLRLYLRGGMIASQHNIELSSYDAVASESSELVQVFLEPLAAPTIAWEPSGDPLADGDAFVPTGPGSRGLLGLVDFAGEVAILQLWPLDDRGWDRTRTRMLELPGLRLKSGEPRAAASALLDDDGSLRVAWRDGVPGSAITAVEVPWDSSANGTPSAVLVPDPKWLGAREWVDVVRPVLAGELVLAELDAPGDAEQPRPGDHVIATAVVADIDEPGAPQLLQLGAVDLDRVTHVIDPLVDATHVSDTLLVRRDHREPLVLDVDRTARTIRRRASTTVALDERWTALAGTPVATASGFGSRIVAGLTGNALAIAMLADRGAVEPLFATVAIDPAATGDPALAWIDGTPIVLVPRGDADVLAVPITSTMPTAQPLVGLACDAIVGPAIPAFGDDQRGEVACLRARSLALVVLRLD